MDLSVLFIDAPNPSSLRAVPQDVSVHHVAAGEALATAQALRSQHVLLLDPQAALGSQAFAVARSLDASGGVLGGCAVDVAGTRRFGSVFAAVPFGPYEVEPFPLIAHADDAPPGTDGIDAVSPGAYVVDRQAFVDVGGFDATLSWPWRACDLSARLRRHGKPVRWEPRFSYTIETGMTSPQDAIDHRRFIETWGNDLRTHFDLETPARGTIRRTVRSPLGQRDVVAVPLPPTDVILCGEGVLTQNRVRSLTRAHRISIRDVRGDAAKGVTALADAFRTRSDRYVTVVDASAELEDGWLERFLVDLESRPTVRGDRSNGAAVVALGRVPLHVVPSSDARSALDALTPVLERPSPCGSRLSVVYLSHVMTEYHRTSFEGVYGGELDIDYHVIATPLRPETLDALRGHATLDLIVDDSAGMARGLNTALARAEGDIVIIIGDDCCPPPGWLDVIREAFSLRPEMGLLGMSAVFVDGPQRVELSYPDIKSFRAVAAARRVTHARDARLTDRLTTLALAVDKRALRAVGGFDERLGAGRWAVEDFTLRVRAAGYAAYITDDLFVHRFSAVDAKPLVNEPDEEARRGAVFAEKWGAARANPHGVDAPAAIKRGFDPERLFVKIEPAPQEERALRDRYDAVFLARCGDDASLENAVSVLRRYLREFSATDAVVFAIEVGGELNVESVGARARAAVRKGNVATEEAADVVIVVQDDDDRDLSKKLASGRRILVHELSDSSPSGLRRAFQ